MPTKIASPARPRHVMSAAAQAPNRIETPRRRLVDGQDTLAGPRRPADESLGAFVRGRPADAVLRRSFQVLHDGWKLRLDPKDEGVAGGWAAPDADESQWRAVQPVRWDKLGHADYSGLGWYRVHTRIPRDWKGGRVDFIVSNIADEFDLFVNGNLVDHRGNRQDGSTFYSQAIIPIQDHLRPGEDNVIALRINDWGNEGGMYSAPTLRRRVPLAEYKHVLPEPVIAARPDWLELYWKAWEEAWLHITPGTPQNRFVSLYMDEAFSPEIFQWDSVFMTLFARYGARLFPSIETLDNFYRGQRDDGYIQRIYNESDGKIVYEPSLDDPNVNPPLFAWAEWEYFRSTGDASRLARVYPILARYYQWLELNCSASDDNGLFFQTAFGSGLDNTPRPGVGRDGSWTDMSLQMALFAKNMSDIADKIGRAGEAKGWRSKYDVLKKTINDLAWDEKDGFYYDLKPGGQKARVKYIGAFWALVSGVADEKKAKALVAHLENEREFKRPHLYPSLAANEPGYEPRGHYWQGGVWGSTNHMIFKGLELAGFPELARRATANHLSKMHEVLHGEIPLADIVPADRDGEYESIWECYAPEIPQPGTREDPTKLSRHHFAGWSAIGPITDLIENVIGITPRGADNTIVWDLTRTDEHGIRRLPLTADNVVDLVATRRDGETLTIQYKAQRPFRLLLRQPGRPEVSLTVPAGSGTLAP